MTLMKHSFKAPSHRRDTFGTVQSVQYSVGLSLLTDRTAYTSTTLGGTFSKLETQLAFTAALSTVYYTNQITYKLRIARPFKISDDLLNILSIPENTKFCMNLVKFVSYVIYSVMSHLQNLVLCMTSNLVFICNHDCQCFLKKFIVSSSSFFFLL